MKKPGYRAVVTESCRRLKKPFYWISCSTIRGYLDEIKSTFEELTGKSVHNFCREVRRVELTRQSIHRIVLQRSAIERAAFKVQIELMDPSFFVWLDETGCDRRYSPWRKAYGLRGSPPVSVRLNLTQSRLSAISAMPIKGIEDVTIYEENVDGQVFSSDLEQTILPILQPFNGSNPQSILIMDNASIHHIEGVMHLIHQNGCLLWFLPAYSPDFNLIEEAFSKVKAFVKKNEATFQSAAVHELPLLLYSAFVTVTPEDCYS